ncbi:MAG: hypothetical protein JXQ93_06235 [Flavobacteriaceae bacterium]
MKTSTSTSKNKFLVSAIVFLTCTALLMSTLLFTSCSDNSENVFDETSLIEQIEAATDKQAVAIEDLPSATSVALTSDYDDSYFVSAELAPGLGYKVVALTDNFERTEADSDVFFTLDGNRLEDNREASRRRRNRCFRFVYPITFIMPDDTNITLESKDDWVLIRTWYIDNPGASERPELVFPVDIMFEDNEVQTIIDLAELREVKQACREDRNRRRCFTLNLPLTFFMPDNSTITVTERANWSLLRAYYIANPDDVGTKPELVYPVDATYRDGSIVTFNNENEMLAAREECRN